MDKPTQAMKTAMEYGKRAMSTENMNKCPKCGEATQVREYGKSYCLHTWHDGHTQGQTPPKWTCPTCGEWYAVGVKCDLCTTDTPSQTPDPPMRAANPSIAKKIRTEKMGRFEREYEAGERPTGREDKDGPISGDSDVRR